MDESLSAAKVQDGGYAEVSGSTPVTTVEVPSGVLVSYDIYCTTCTEAGILKLIRTFGHYVVAMEGHRVVAGPVRSVPLPENLTTEASANQDCSALR